MKLPWLIIMRNYYGWRKLGHRIAARSADKVRSGIGSRR